MRFVILMYAVHILCVHLLVLCGSVKYNCRVSLTVQYQAEHSVVGILVQVTKVYRRIRIGRDGYLDQSKAYSSWARPKFSTNWGD